MHKWDTATSALVNKILPEKMLFDTATGCKYDTKPKSG